MPTNIIIIGGNSLGLSVARECAARGITVTVIETGQAQAHAMWECRKAGCNVYTNTTITDIRHTEMGTIVYAVSANHKPRRYVANLVLQAADTTESQLHSFILEAAHAVFPGRRWRTIRTINHENKQEIINYFAALPAFKDKAPKK